MAQNILVFKSLKEISAVRFHEIKFDGNIKLMDKDYNEDKLYTIPQIVELNDSWLKLYDEYFEKTLDTRFTKTLKNNKKGLELLFTISIIETILQQMEFAEENADFMPDNLYVETLVNLKNNLKRIDSKIKFNDSLELKDAIQPVKDYLGGLQTRYKLLFREDLKVEKKDISEFYRIKAEIENILQRNLDESVNMLQWIFYVKQYQREVKKQNGEHSRAKGSTRHRKGMG